MRPNKYYSLEQHDKKAELVIYGDITSWPWMESDVSAYNLSKQLKELDADEITVRINSYGGEVAEGLAIYNALMNSRAKVTTVCDGFACSIASVIFMAGTERVMNDASMLMIHNAWMSASGNAAELRKAAADVEKITEASIKAYMSRVSIKEEELRALMDAESFLDSDEAVSKGFATRKVEAKAENPSQNARRKVFQMLKNPYLQLDEEEEDPGNPAEDPETGSDGTNGTDGNSDTEEDQNGPETDSDEPESTDGATDEDDSTENGENTGETDDSSDENEENAQQMAFFKAILNM